MRRILILFAAACVAIPVAFALDPAVDGFFARHPLETQRVGGAIGRYVDWPYQLLVCAGVAIWARRTGRRKALRVALCMILASTLSGAVANAVRYSTGRTRPSADVPQGWYGVRHEGEWMLAKDKFKAFPSAHSSTTSAFLGLLAFSGTRLSLPAALLLPIVPLARMTSRSHHFSDTVVGTCLGLLTAAWVWRTRAPLLRCIVHAWRGRPWRRRRTRSAR